MRLEARDRLQKPRLTMMEAADGMKMVQDCQKNQIRTRSRQKKAPVARHREAPAGALGGRFHCSAADVPARWCSEAQNSPSDGMGMNLQYSVLCFC